MKSKGQRAAVTTGLMGLCLLFCLAISVSVVRRCEAAFYDRAAAVASVFPDKASDVMAALKIPSAADLLAGRNILSAYGYNGQLLDARFIAAEIISVSLLYLLCFFIIAALALAAGRRREARRIADLVQYLRQVESGVYPVQAVDPLLKQNRQNLVIQGDNDSVLFCDFGWTAEAFGNLIKNCSEHSPEGSQITAAAEQNPIYTQITIEDEGSGFSPEDIPHLFERFYRGKQAVRGSIGIGLALAKSIVERQGGELYAENSKDCSARYVIRFYEHAPEENNEYMRSLTPNC